jgi:NADH-quinone oxidoreductase subunit E
MAFRKETLAAIDRLREEYPDGRSLLIPVLKLAQEELGHLSPEVLAYVGDLLDVPESVAAGVATFYHTFFTQPCGRHVIQVCRTLSCELAGGREVANRFKELLEVDLGGTTDDGLVTLRSAECLAACGTAPAVLIDDDYFEQLDVSACDEIVRALRAGEQPPGGSGVPGGEPHASSTGPRT